MRFMTILNRQHIANAEGFCMGSNTSEVGNPPTLKKGRVNGYDFIAVKSRAATIRTTVKSRRDHYYWEEKIPAKEEIITMKGLDDE